MTLEVLAYRQAFTFFATHFQELAQTLCTYRGVQTYVTDIPTQLTAGCISASK